MIRNAGLKKLGAVLPLDLLAKFYPSLAIVPKALQAVTGRLMRREIPATRDLGLCLTAGKRCEVDGPTLCSRGKSPML